MVIHSKLPTVAVLWTVLGLVRGYCNKTADLSSFMDSFGAGKNLDVNKTANGCSFMDTFGGSEKSGKQNCKRLQFYGHFWSK